jgi:cytochrome c biogenesis protein CcdA
MGQLNDDTILDDKIKDLTKLYLSNTISKEEFESRKNEIIHSYTFNKKHSFNDISPNRKYSNKLYVLAPLFLVFISVVYLIIEKEKTISLMPLLESLGQSNIPLIAAFFIGLMTAISPCPLATNITAIAYTSKKIGNSKHTLLVGVLYTMGRMIVYIGIAAIIVWIGISTFSISITLQKYGKILLGPLLLIFGVLMLNVINISFGKSSDKLNKIKESLSEKGLIGSLLLGMLFALAFCPISGVFYFGMLIPLALQNSDPILIPSLFAFATGLPVIIFSLILVFSVSKIGDVMKKVQTFEKWMRKAVAIIFISVGIYYLFLI